MQYRKHNFAYNFMNAQAVDVSDAWEILLGEINELVLSDVYRAESIQKLKDAKVNVPADISDKNLTVLIFDTIWDNVQFRAAIITSMIAMHQTPYTGAEIGVYDQIIPGEKTPQSALNKLIATEDPDVTRDSLRKQLTKDMVDKKSMRDLSVNFIDRIKSAGFLKVTGAVLGLTALSWATYCLITDKPLIPKFK